jgi:hypothetical protein
MNKRNFTTPKDAEMRAVILAIPESLHTGSRDIYDARLVEVEDKDASFALLYQNGPRLQVRDADTGSAYTMLSSLFPIDQHSRTMAFSASFAETQNVPLGLLSPELQGCIQENGRGDPGVEITKMWAYSASARQEEIDRNACTTVTFGTKSIFLYPNVPLADQHFGNFPLELISRAELSRVPIPSHEELDVQRFNRIIVGLGFSTMQVS